MNTINTKNWMLTLLLYTLSQSVLATDVSNDISKENTTAEEASTSISSANNPPKNSLDDDKQPIQIQADSLQASEKQGKSVYSGNVEIKQGSLVINGDRIEVNHPDGQLQKVITIGQPASFKRFNPTENSWVVGQANNIEYDTLKKTVKLSGNAQVEQPGKHIIKGSVLFYDLTKQTLNANSSGTTKERVSVTFSPQITSQPQNTAPLSDSESPSQKVDENGQ